MIASKTDSNDLHEAALLGVVILEPREIPALASLAPEHFADPRLGLAWRTLRELHAKGAFTNNPTLLAAELERAGVPAEIGDAAGICSMVQLAADGLSAQHHARAIVRDYGVSKLANILGPAIESLAGKYPNPGEIVARLTQQLAELSAGPKLSID